MKYKWYFQWNCLQQQSGKSSALELNTFKEIVLYIYNHVVRIVMAFIVLILM